MLHHSSQTVIGQKRAYVSDTMDVETEVHQAPKRMEQDCDCLPPPQSQSQPQSQPQSRQVSTATIFDLPDDMFRLISTWLDGNSQRHFAACCHTFRQIFHYYTHAKIRAITNLFDYDRLQRFLVKNTQKLCSSPDHRRLGLMTFETVTMLELHVRTVTMCERGIRFSRQSPKYDIEEGSMTACLERFKHLERLEIIVGILELNAVLGRDNYVHRIPCDNLKHLSLMIYDRISKIDSYLKLPSTLESMYIYYGFREDSGFGIPIDLLLHHIITAPSVKRFHLKTTSDVDRINVLFKAFPGLEELDLGDSLVGSHMHDICHSLVFPKALKRVLCFYPPKKKLKDENQDGCGGYRYNHWHKCSFDALRELLATAEHPIQLCNMAVPADHPDAMIDIHRGI